MIIYSLYRDSILEELNKDPQSFHSMYMAGDNDEHKCSADTDEVFYGKVHIQDRSYCPWYNVINFDEKRYVQNIQDSKV